MAVHEKIALLRGKTASGDSTLVYPITKLDCVDGAEDLLHYGVAQDLTEDEQDQACENIGAAKKTDLTDLAVLARGNEDDIHELQTDIEGLGDMVDQNKAAVSSLETKVEHVEEQIAGLSGITFIESSTDNFVNVRDLESGTYVFLGKFKPYAGSTSTLSFSSRLLVNIVRSSSYTSMMVLYPVNNCIQYMKITDTASEKKYVYLNDLMDAVDALETSVGDVADLGTTAKTDLVSAINELVGRIAALEAAAGGN